MVDTYPASTAQLRAAVSALLPQLQATIDATDRARQVPEEVVAALRAAGVYRMFLPKELGGNPVDLQTFVDVVEGVAEGSAAAGWDVATSSVMTMAALLLPREGAARIFRPGRDLIAAGSLGGGRGRAVVADGGYRVGGRWGFASGCGEAEWIGGSCSVFDGDDPRLNANGQPQVLIAFFPRASVTVHDTWRVVGMRGTGSHDWSVTDAFVPAPLTVMMPAASSWPGTLYRLPLAAITAVHFSAVATGIARRAIDCLMELAQSKTPAFERRYSYTQGLLRERVQVQEAVARAEVLLESARAYRSRIVADVWATAEAGESLSMPQRARLRLAGTNAAECAVRAVDLMFQAGGTTAIDEASPLAQCFRDVHVVAQSIAVYSLNYEHVGRVLLGLEPGTPLF